MNAEVTRLPSITDALAKIFHDMIMDFEEHNPRTYIRITWNCESLNSPQNLSFPESGYLYVNVPSVEILDFIDGILPPEEEIMDSTIELICFDENRKYVQDLSKYAIHKPMVDMSNVVLTRFY